MFTHSIARNVTDWLVQGGAVQELNREVYEFGLEKLISLLINTLIMLVLGSLFGILLQTIVFYMTYMVLRVYAGGYHAENSIVCFFVSIAILIPCVIAIRYYYMWNIPIVFWSLLVASVIILIIVSPVEHKNKMLDAKEKNVYRKRALRNMLVVATCAIVLTLLSFNIFAVAMLCGIVLTAATAGLGKLVLASKT